VSDRNAADNKTGKRQEGPFNATAKEQSNNKKQCINNITNQQRAREIQQIEH